MADLKLVADTKQSRMARLQREWQSLNHKEKRRTAEDDHTRAQILAEAVNDGLEQWEVAQGLLLSQQRISQLLRYHRFNTTSGSIDITERTFRAYWEFVRDPQKTHGKRKPEDKEAYEQEAFQVIARMIEEGKELPTRQRAKPLAEIKPDRYEENRNFRANMQKDLKQFISEFKVDVEWLVKLGEADHPMRVQPDFMSGLAQRLAKKLGVLETLVEGMTGEKAKTIESRRPK